MHEASAAQRGFSTQRSTAGLGLSPAKRNYFLARRQVSLSCVGVFFGDGRCVRLIFLCLQNISPLAQMFDMQHPRSKCYNFAHHPSDSEATCSQRSSPRSEPLLPDIACRHETFREKKPLAHTAVLRT